MELGFEKVSYDVLEKLSNFYSVDITYFGEAHEMQKTATNENVKKEAATQKVKKTYTRTKKIKVFNILTLISSILLLISIITPIYRIDIMPLHLLFGSGFSVVIAIFMVICAIWCLVNAILHMSSKVLDQGVYGLISKIITVVLTSITTLFVFILFIELAGIGGYLPIIHVIIYIVALVFEIVKLVLHVKNNKKED